MDCVLHIGTEKTGTTMLQGWLYSNEEVLNRHGVALSHTLLVPNNRALAMCFQQKIDPFFYRLGLVDESKARDFIDKTKRAFAEEVSSLQPKYQVCLITSELLQSRLETEQEVHALSAYLKEIFERVTIICYFREQSQVRKSLWSSALKSSRSVPLESFAPNAGEDGYYWNYLRFADKWAAAFGKENLRFRLFDRSELAEGDLRKDFMKTADLGVPLEELDYNVSSANESLNSVQARLFRAINIARPPLPPNVQDPTAIALRAAVMRVDAIQNEPAIADPSQRNLFDRMVASNKAFFAKYFGRPDTNFQPPSNQEPEEREDLPLETVENIISTLAASPGLLFAKRAEVTLLRRMLARLETTQAIDGREAAVLRGLIRRSRYTAKAIPPGAN